METFHAVENFLLHSLLNHERIFEVLIENTISLQDDPSTNAGRGSNLTEDGHVEGDASIMDGDSGAFGAVGAVPGINKGNII